MTEKTQKGFHEWVQDLTKKKLPETYVNLRILFTGRTEEVVYTKVREVEGRELATCMVNGSRWYTVETDNATIHLRLENIESFIIEDIEDGDES